MAPLGEGGRTVLLEDVAANDVAFLNERIMDQGVSGGELLKGLHGIVRLTEVVRPVPPRSLWARAKHTYLPEDLQAGGDEARQRTADSDYQIDLI